MIPVLYKSNETDFTHNGIGWLTDIVKCTTTMEKGNGLTECEFTYPITGLHYSEITLDRIVKVKAAEVMEPQLFRIYRISKPINGIVKYYCQHISYDLAGVIVNPALADSQYMGEEVPFELHNVTASQVITHLNNMSVYLTGFTNRFTITATSSTLHDYQLEKPTPLRDCIGGGDNSLLSIYGGELSVNNFTITLAESIGQDNGVTILYGKNLTDINAESSIAETYTAILPYAIDNDNDELVTLPDSQNVKDGVMFTNQVSNYGEMRVLPVDFTDKFDLSEEDITTTKLARLASEYITTQKVTDIYQNIEVSFVGLWQTEEYKDIALLERVQLGDTVTVKYPTLGVSVKARVVKTIFDSINERYEKIELGEVKGDFGSALVKASKTLENIVENGATKSDLQKEIDHATKIITGQEGGYVYISNQVNYAGETIRVYDPTTNTYSNVTYPAVSTTLPKGEPGEICIMDAPTRQSATGLWRWNLGGLGYSSNGYNGTYKTALTRDGHIVADFITAGTLSGNIIRAGIIEDNTANGAKNYWNLGTGEFRLTAGTKVLRENGTDSGIFYKANGELRINADFIKSGTLDANLITAGKIQDAHNYNYWNLDTGELKISATQAKIGNQTVSNYVSNAANSVLTQTNVFNALTNNGTLQGLFMATDPNDGRQKLYINATYIKSGIINADLIQAGTMSANRVRAGAIVSQDNNVTFDLDYGNITLAQIDNNIGIGSIKLNSAGIYIADPSNNDVGWFTIMKSVQNGSTSYSSVLSSGEIIVNNLTVNREISRLGVGVLSASTRLETKALQATNLFSNQISTQSAIVGSLSIQGNNPKIYFDGLPLSWIDTTINGTSYKLLGYSTGGSTTPVSVEVSLNTTYYDVDQTSGVFKGQFGRYTVTDTNAGKTYKIAAYSCVSENTNATQNIEDVSYYGNTLYLQTKGSYALLKLNENDYQSKNPNATKFSYTSGNVKYILSPLTLNFGDFKGVYFGYETTS